MCLLLAPPDPIFEPVFEAKKKQLLGGPAIPQNPLKSALENLNKVIQKITAFMQKNRYIFNISAFLFYFRG